MHDDVNESGKDFKGSILRIEKTSIHDGEGLRTVVFLKGCPLQCQWCSAPESQNITPEVGYLKERCRGCGACVDTCPQGALEQDAKSGKIRIDRARCDGCFKCVRLCPANALKAYGSVMTVSEVVREIEKDEVFYFHSGGGVTISGGEPLMQAGFVRELLKKCRQRGIHSAVETTLYGDWEKIEGLLPFLGTLYADLKHPDSKRHEFLVGAGNALILDNIRKVDLSKEKIDFIVRIPVIPGVNDSQESLFLSAEFLGTLKRLTAVELLAYHRLGIETYDRLGREYPLREIASPGGEYMRSKAEILARKIPRSKIRINGMSL